MKQRKVLFIAQHRPDRSPSQRFRFEQYLSIFEEAGYQYEHSHLIDAQDDRIFYSKGNLRRKGNIVLKSFRRRQQDLKRLREFDIVFVQREAFMTGTTYFERHFSKSNTKFVFDFDDSIWLHNVSDANKYLNFLKNPQKTSVIIKLADHVIAGNAYLEDYAKGFNPNVSIIPTTIDTDRYTPKPALDKDSVTIGWSGSITTIQHLNLAVEVLGIVKRAFGDRVDFKVIGDPNFRHEELGIVGQAWKSETEIDDLRSIDIGIMPLPDSEWAQGKCGLKGLQYMALGIPTIMTPVGVNTEIVVDGKNGFLAVANDTWFEKLKLLIENAELRKSLGEAGRATVEEKYSVKANAGLYLNLFDQLLS